jgi:hypothetical protein
MRGVVNMNYKTKNNSERLKMSNLPNFITMANMSDIERIKLCSEIVKSKRAETINNYKNEVFLSIRSNQLDFKNRYFNI